MSKKADIKTCRFVGCPHGKKIDISIDNYVIPKKGMYYHEDCYKKQKEGNWKDKQTRADLQYIKEQWVLRIDRDVIFSQLMRVLNDFIGRGVPSDYLVFAFDYVVQHKMKLNYPYGFKYYIDNKEIKEAYEKSKLPKIDNSKFVVKSTEFEPPQKVEPSPLIANKPKGFGSILCRNKKE
jgi:hypothetical protein